MTYKYFWVNAFFSFWNAVRLYQEELQVISISGKFYRIWQMQMILLYCVLLQDSALIMVLWLHGKSCFSLNNIIGAHAKLPQESSSSFCADWTMCWKAELWCTFLCNCFVAQEWHWKVPCRAGGPSQRCWRPLRAKVSDCSLPGSVLAACCRLGKGNRAHGKEAHVAEESLCSTWEF